VTCVPVFILPVGGALLPRRVRQLCIRGGVSMPACQTHTGVWQARLFTQELEPARTCVFCLRQPANLPGRHVKGRAGPNGRQRTPTATLRFWQPNDTTRRTKMPTASKDTPTGTVAPASCRSSSHSRPQTLRFQRLPRAGRSRSRGDSSSSHKPERERGDIGSATLWSWSHMPAFLCDLG
jgi:hypothetical protein